MILAMLAAAATSFTALPPADEQDLRCLAFLSRAAGKVEGDQRHKVDAGAIWFFGRLAARSPSIDPLAQVAKIIGSPAYDRAAYEADKQRCHVELQSLAPRYESWEATYQSSAAAPGSGSSGQ
jgi:hypothetical protein